MKHLILSLSLFLISSLGGAQQKWSSINEQLFLVQGSGAASLVFFASDGASIVDTQYQGDAKEILNTLQNKFKTPVSNIFNTHWHPDHVFGNETLVQSNTKIWGTEKAALRMSTPQYIHFFDLKVDPLPKKARVNRVVKEKSTIHLGAERIHLVPFPPAHTDGDMIVYFDNSNVIHSGDIFFNSIYPFIDYSTGGTLEGFIEAAKYVYMLANPGTLIIGGHGKWGTKSDLLKMIHMLEDMKETLYRLRVQGYSDEEILALKPSAKFDKEWAWEVVPPDRFVKMLLLSLKPHPDLIPWWSI